jgi:hypothetical protein
MKQVLLLCCLAGCASPMPAGVGGGGGGGGGGPMDLSMDPVDAGELDFATPPVSHDLAGMHDLAVAHDLAMPQSVDLAMPQSADLSAPQSGCVPRVNEVMTGTSSAGTAEFVELYNPCAAAVDVSNWKLVYRAATNVAAAGAGDSSTLFTFAASTSIGSHQFRVYGGAGFGGTKDGALSASMKDGEGAVGLRDASGNLVDSVGYGTVDPTSAFIRGTAAAAPPVTAAGSSIGRQPDGTDTGNNSVDFKISTAISPGAANN